MAVQAPPGEERSNLAVKIDLTFGRGRLRAGPQHREHDDSGHDRLFHRVPLEGRILRKLVLRLRLCLAGLQVFATISRFQYELDETTSLPARVPRLIQMYGWIESFMNRTLPSTKRTLTPPGWLLCALLYDASSGVQPGQDVRHEFQGKLLEFGVTMVWNRVIDTAPQPQRAPFRLDRFVFD